MSVIKPEHIGKEMTGKEFNEAYPDIDLVKLTNKKEIHHGFQFTDGLNIDTFKFNSEVDCSPGGIYFVEKVYASEWIHYITYFESKMMSNIRKVTIPNDARVYIEPHYCQCKIKADKIILAPKEAIGIDVYVQYLKNDPRGERAIFNIPEHVRYEVIAAYKQYN